MTPSDIVDNIDNAAALEKLYRENKAAFKSAFIQVYPEINNKALAEFWRERLQYVTIELSWGSGRELIFVILLALIAGLIAKIPAIFKLDPENFYQRNIGLIVFPAMSAYFIWKNRLHFKRMILVAIIFLVAAIYINWLPGNQSNNSLVLACIHLPIFLWAVLGYSFIAGDTFNDPKRIAFLRYNGDLVIMSALLFISGVILSAITIRLFSFLGLDFDHIYFDYIGIFGLAAIPIIASYITQTNPKLVNKISPIIAKIFSPLVLIMLIVYLIAILVSGKNPYKDRDFLLVFNFLLIGVMALILFSIAASTMNKENRSSKIILFALSIVTIIVNLIAVSAIIFRISEWGFTPNRLAVLGGNVLILTHLCLVSVHLFKNSFRNGAIEEVENSIARFLPVYIIWTMIVIFIFPVIFHFK